MSHQLQSERVWELFSWEFTFVRLCMRVYMLVERVLTVMAIAFHSCENTVRKRVEPPPASTPVPARLIHHLSPHDSPPLPVGIEI